MSHKARSGITVIIGRSCIARDPNHAAANVWKPGFYRLLTMKAKKHMLVADLIAALIALLGVWIDREAKGLAGPDAGSATNSPQSGPSSQDSISGPVKTKVDRSRAITLPSTEEVEAAAARKRTAFHNARQISLAMFEFESKFGAFPNEETAAAVAKATGTTARLGAATANDCFYQLMAANIMPAPDLFTWEEPGQDKGALGLEKCAFSYLSGMNAAGNPRRPLVVAPLVPGTRFFDRETFGGKAVILRVDGSMDTFDIERDGTVKLDGMDLFDPDQPIWGGTVPTIKWPAQ